VVLWCELDAGVSTPSWYKLLRLTRLYPCFPSQFLYLRYAVGLNDAVLLGQTDFAVAQLVQKAAAGPPSGYRFSGYAPSTGDSDPGDEYYVNLVRALQEMVLQSGDDGYANTTIVLFPSWPCDWDLEAKLWGPLNTTLEIVYSGGSLVSLIVTPPERAASVKWAACVPSSGASDSH
jgi:hypothetical protein